MLLLYVLKRLGRHACLPIEEYFILLSSFRAQRYYFFSIYTKKSLRLSDFFLYYCSLLLIKRFGLLDLGVDLLHARAELLRPDFYAAIL